MCVPTLTFRHSLSAVTDSVHPVPGTEDGKPNPDFKRGIIASQPNGREWVWGAPQMSDPFQGPAYHISKAKDAASGERWRRFERFLEAVPVEATVHCERPIDPASLCRCRRLLALVLCYRPTLCSF